MKILPSPRNLLLKLKLSETTVDIALSSTSQWHEESLLVTAVCNEGNSSRFDFLLKDSVAKTGLVSSPDPELQEDLSAKFTGCGLSGRTKKVNSKSVGENELPILQCYHSFFFPP